LDEARIYHVEESRKPSKEKSIIKENKTENTEFQQPVPKSAEKKKVMPPVKNNYKISDFFNLKS